MIDIAPQVANPRLLARFFGPGEQVVLVRNGFKMRVVHYAPRLENGWRDLTKVTATALKWPIYGDDLAAEAEMDFILALCAAIPTLTEITIRDFKPRGLH